tara:strand:+ start:843 stop:1226 length:384 start_codon:yes stop_codon:yes gene_type:complete
MKGNLVKAPAYWGGNKRCLEYVEIEEIHYNEVYHTATGINGQGSSDESDLIPIDLFEKATNLGFEELSKDYFSLNHCKTSFVYYYTRSGSSWTFELNGEPIKILYVHQFQNLFRLTTGEEISLENIV